MKAKKLLILVGITCFTLAAIFSPGVILSAQAAAPEEYSTQAAIIEWRFKIENNKLYKRLYNYTTCEWVGDWIFVRDL